MTKHAWLSWLRPQSAQPGQRRVERTKTMAAQMDELAATLTHMEALLEDAPIQMRLILEQQIASARDTLLLFGPEKPAAPKPLPWSEVFPLAAHAEINQARTNRHQDFP